MTMFSQTDLDAVLYGYIRQHHVTTLPDCIGDVISLALTGLGADFKLSHGVDRILGPDSCFKLSQRTLSVPKGLELFKSTIAGMLHHGIRCASNHRIHRGTRFGPYTGRLVSVAEIKLTDDNNSMWEVYDVTAQLRHFIDGSSGANTCWMAYVNCARCPAEQNLEMVQTADGFVFYDVIKDIDANSELLVWYSDKCYEQFMGIPVSLHRPLLTTFNNDVIKKISPELGNLSANEEKIYLRATQVTETSADGYQCYSCGKVFAYRYYRDKHLKYTRCIDRGDRKFPCHLCTRSFEKRDRLRIHVLHVHEKHQPHTCCVCSKRFSQSSSLNKHMRVHSGERPYKCLYCTKAFTASSILRTHIRQHSGEKPFKCRHCGRAFASHAAHDSHVRRTHQSRDIPGHLTSSAPPRLNDSSY